LTSHTPEFEHASLGVIQLLQLHLLELDPARKQLAASTSADLVSRTRINLEQLRESSPSEASIRQLLQAEVRT